jgi:YidC/Oxa1 family membrane protein insertase
LHVVLATSWLDPFTAMVWWVVQEIDAFTHNAGVSLIILALLIRVVFWGLNVKQFRAMIDMQRIAPKLKQLQERHKGDAQRLQQEQMALYREAGVNPLSGCLPMVIQLPFLYAVYWVIALNATLRNPKTNTPNYMCQAHVPSWFSTFPLHAQLHALCFNGQHFLWIGSPLSAAWPHVFAPNLAVPDVPLILLYAFSMYLSMRYGSAPSTDPQQAQTQRIMALFMPLMIGFFSWRYNWASAMVLYWFAYNAFTMSQQIYLLRRYHQPLSALDSEHVLTESAKTESAKTKTAPAATGDGAAKTGTPLPGGDGAARKRRRRRKKR